MPRVLAAVDGTERASSIADYIVDWLPDPQRTQVLVLNAQPKPLEWQTRGLARTAIMDRLAELGNRATAHVVKRLEQAHIPASRRVELGHPDDIIIRCAREEGCNLIIVGTAPLGSVARALARGTGITWGSVASRVARLATVPVVVVK